jgi:O-succinylbenzoate synthase
MRVKRIELRQIELPLLHFFETSFGRTMIRRIVLVRVDSEGVTGWGEVACGESPFYNYETPETAWHILKDFLIPRVLGKEWSAASDLVSGFVPIRGHNMAKAALECALWDIEAQTKGLPLWKLIGGSITEIPCGVSLGIQATVDELLEKIQEELESGYQRIKVKIKPGWDVEVIDKVRQRFPRVALMADANSAYRLKDMARLKLLDRFFLMMIEQPLGWDDMLDHARLQREITTPICLDESIHSGDDARKALEAGACKIINIKLGRVGGYVSARQAHDACHGRRVPVWCGGMLESGIGRAHNIALSTLPGFVLPGDVSASKRYWAEDIIEPEVTVTSRGTIRVPESSGLGFAPRLDRIEKLARRREVFE